MLSLQNVQVSSADKQILRTIDSTFKKNHRYVLMGPNGSGKSTLAHTIMGNPEFKLHEQSKIILDGEDITQNSPEKRMQKGIFVTFQSPVALSGVTVMQLVKASLGATSTFEHVRKKITQYAKELKIPEDLLERSVHKKASGGERKKIELLQAAILGKKVIIFDEFDSGMDVDALKICLHFIQKYLEEKTLIFITHNSRIVKYLKPDKVLVMIKGAIVAQGDTSLVERIENKGYEVFIHPTDTK